MYIGWVNNVNKVILDSTSVSVGENAVVQDTLEAGGQKKSRLVSVTTPDKFSVTMEFSFDDDSLDENGHTELERFWIWYKYRHCYGVNPFLFPAILINSNRQSGDSVESREHTANSINNQYHPEPPYTEANIPDFEYYVITSAVNGSKSGNCLQVTMTWETYATGAYTVPDDTSTIDHFEAHNGYVDVTLTSIPDTEPTKDTWTATIKKGNGSYTSLPFTASFFDGDVSVRLYFTPKSTAGTYTVKMYDLPTSSFTVGA